MKNPLSLIMILLLFISVSCTLNNNTLQWKPADNPIMTKWASDVDPHNPWLQYPRPDLVRTGWVSLNGLWDYTITQKDTIPENWDGKILVPYPVESALSGVKKRVSEEREPVVQKNIQGSQWLEKETYNAEF